MDHQDALSERDIKVLMALEENPLGTFDELSDLTGLAKSVVFNIYQKLEQTTLDRPPLFSVVATTNHKALGMEVFDVIVHAPTKSQWELLDLLCYEHPYTIYRSLIYGESNGVFFQFRVPFGSGKWISVLFDDLKRTGDLESYHILQFSNPAIYTTTKVKYWNHTALKWNFDWGSWFDRMDNVPSKDPLLKTSGSLGAGGSSLKWMKRSDILILNELVDNSRRKKVDIIDAIKKKEGIEFTPQTFSRRVKKLKQECIIGYRLFIVPRLLDLHNTILIRGTATPEFIRKLAYALESYPIPFLSNFRYSETEFIWYIHLPSTHLADLLFSLKPNVGQIRFYFVDHSRSRLYYIYTDAFKEKTKSWKDSEQFMVSDVLAHLEGWKKKHKRE